MIKFISNSFSTALNVVKKGTVITLCMVLMGLFLAVGCKKDDGKKDPIHGSTENQVLMLMVDYTTNTFMGGKEFTFTKNSDTFTIGHEYASPGDFGHIKLFYEEMDELLFYGTIVWLGCGEMIFPEDLLEADQFQFVNTDDYVLPKNGFETIVFDAEFDHEHAWGSVQALVKAREYLRSNPEQVVKLFFYTPSVGMGNPDDWYWIIFLKR